MSASAITAFKTVRKTQVTRWSVILFCDMENITVMHLFIFFPLVPNLHSAPICPSLWQQALCRTTHRPNRSSMGVGYKKSVTSTLSEQDLLHNEIISLTPNPSWLRMHLRQLLLYRAWTADSPVPYLLLLFTPQSLRCHFLSHMTRLCQLVFCTAQSLTYERKHWNKINIRY